MQWWQLCVKQLSIAPSEAWSLDFIEVRELFELNKEKPQDLSLMLNAQRMMNGATKEFLEMA